MAQRNIDRLIEIMARLRHPERGCPWDLEQSFATIAPYTIEEAYEVADAIARQDADALRDELGDLLLQVVFHARIAEEAGTFDFEAVAAAISDKMIRRHPHVFGEDAISDSESQRMAWESHKAAERAAKAGAAGNTAVSALDGVALALPALMRALKLQRRAAGAGFDWDAVAPILDKVEEEIRELRAELAQGSPPLRLEDELGDILFSLVNLARRLSLDPEAALRQANAKFERRFRRVEAMLAERGKLPTEATLAEMDALWHLAKLEERAKDTA
ncbi:MAG: nucleoside triphosphate pyrophosphohydrolase [Alphaproteobacteria bacterium]